MPIKNEELITEQTIALDHGLKKAQTDFYRRAEELCCYASELLKLILADVKPRSKDLDS